MAVSPERKGVVSLPRLPSAGSRVIVAVSFAETPRLLASSGEATSFAVLVIVSSRCPSIML